MFFLFDNCVSEHPTKFRQQVTLSAKAEDKLEEITSMFLLPLGVECFFIDH